MEQDNIVVKMEIINTEPRTLMAEWKVYEGYEIYRENGEQIKELNDLKLGDVVYTKLEYQKGKIITITKVSYDDKTATGQDDEKANVYYLHEFGKDDRNCWVQNCLFVDNSENCTKEYITII